MKVSAGEVLCRVGAPGRVEGSIAKRQRKHTTHDSSVEGALQSLPGHRDIGGIEVEALDFTLLAYLPADGRDE